jgi:hypothetical protein
VSIISTGQEGLGLVLGSSSTLSFLLLIASDATTGTCLTPKDSVDVNGEPLADPSCRPENMVSSMPMPKRVEVAVAGFFADESFIKLPYDRDVSAELCQRLIRYRLDELPITGPGW